MGDVKVAERLRPRRTTVPPGLSAYASTMATPKGSRTSGARPGTRGKTRGVADVLKNVVPLPAVAESDEKSHNLHASVVVEDPGDAREWLIADEPSVHWDVPDVPDHHDAVEVPESVDDPEEPVEVEQSVTASDEEYAPVEPDELQHTAMHDDEPHHVDGVLEPDGSLESHDSGYSFAHQPTGIYNHFASGKSVFSASSIAPAVSKDIRQTIGQLARDVVEGESFEIFVTEIKEVITRNSALKRSAGIFASVDGHDVMEEAFVAFCGHYGAFIDDSVYNDPTENELDASIYQMLQIAHREEGKAGSSASLDEADSMAKRLEVVHASLAGSDWADGLARANAKNVPWTEFRVAERDIIRSSRKRVADRLQEAAVVFMRAKFYDPVGGDERMSEMDHYLENRDDELRKEYKLLYKERYFGPFGVGDRNSEAPDLKAPRKKDIVAEYVTLELLFRVFDEMIRNITFAIVDYRNDPTMKKAGIDIVEEVKENTHKILQKSIADLTRELEKKKNRRSSLVRMLGWAAGALMLAAAASAAIFFTGGLAIAAIGTAIGAWGLAATLGGAGKSGASWGFKAVMNKAVELWHTHDDIVLNQKKLDLTENLEGALQGIQGTRFFATVISDQTFMKAVALVQFPASHFNSDWNRSTNTAPGSYGRIRVSRGGNAPDRTRIASAYVRSGVLVVVTAVMPFVSVLTSF